MMKVPLLDLKVQHKAIRDEILPALREVLEDQHFMRSALSFYHK